MTLPYKTQVEYITSEASHLCRFIVENLPYTGESGEVFEYETKFRYHTRATISEEGDSNVGGYYWQTGSNSNYVRLGGSNPDLYELSTTNFQTLRLKRIAGSKAELYINGNYVGERTNGIGNVPPTNNSFYLFGGKTANQYYMLQDKCYAKFWKDGILIRYYVPVIDNDRCCWYDNVNKEFLYAESEALEPTVWGNPIAPYKDEIESISSTASAPCRFTMPVDIKATDSWEFETDIRWLSYPSALNIELNANTSGNWYGVTSAGIYTITPNSTTSCSTDKFDNIRFTLQSTTTNLYVNGTMVVDKGNSGRVALTELPIYWAKFGSTYYSMFVERKYLSLKVNGKYVHYYTPVLDWADTPCFYDTVNGELLYADAGYEPKVYGGVISETPSTYQRQKQLLIANKGILPYYCELEYISYPTLFSYDMTVTATSVIEIETAIKYLGSIGGGNQLEGNSTAGRWYGIDDYGNYTLGGGITSTTPASTTGFDKIYNVQNLGTAINTLNVNGVDILTRTGIAQTTSLTYGMFGVAAYKFNVAKKYHKVWIDGKLVYDYIPVLDYDGVPCWYNRVDGQFLYADTGQTPTVWGREIHPIEKLNKERLRYWDLGAFLVEPTDTIEMKFKRDDNSVNQIMFRQTATIDSVVTTILNCTISNKYFSWSWFSATSSGNNFATTLNEDIIDLKLNANEITVNGVTQTVSFTDNVVPDSDFYLFGLPTNSSKFYGDFYYFKNTSAGGTVKINIIPIVDETGTPYLWDSVGRTILIASGSGALTYDPIELDYVENTVNSNGAYSIIPYTPNANTEFNIDFQIDDMTSARYIAGRSGWLMSHGSASEHRLRLIYGSGNILDVTDVPNLSNRVNVHRLSYNNRINGVEYDNNEGTLSISGYIGLFTLSDGTSNGLVGKVFLSTIKENGQWFFNLIPAIKDGQVGLLDTLTNTLYPSERADVPFVPHFLPQRKMFNALDGLTYWEWEIDTTLLDANNKTFGFYQNTPNFDIDWGDGNYEVGQLSHTYATAGKYTIRIYKTGNLGRFYWYDSTTPNQYGVCLTAVNTPMPTINQSDISNCFRGCTNLTKVCDDFFVNNRHATYVNYFFYECPLTYVPKNILKGMYLLGSVTGLFGKTNVSEVPVDLFADVKTNCTLAACFTSTKIKTLPAHLIDRLVDTNTCSQFINQCTELEYLPDLFFKYQTKVENWRYLAYGSTKLKLNANLFCDEATEMTTRFASVSSLDFTGAFSKTAYTGTEAGTAPQLWNYTYGGAPTTTGCFSGAGNQTLTNYSSIPSAWGGPA